MSLLARRGRHQSPYPAPARQETRSEGQEPDTLVDALWADRDHDVKAIIAAELTRLAQHIPF